MSKSNSFTADDPRITGTAKSSAVQTTAGQRAVGRLVDLSDAQAENQGEMDLASDLFQAMFHGRVVLKPQDQIPAGRVVNAKLLDYVQTKVWQQPLNATMSNIPASVFGALAAHSVMLNDEIIKEALKEQDKADKSAQQSQKAKEQAEQAQQKAQEAQQKLGEANKKAKEAGQKAKQAQKNGTPEQQAQAQQQQAQAKAEQSQAKKEAAQAKKEAQQAQQAADKAQEKADGYAQSAGQKVEQMGDNKMLSMALSYAAQQAGKQAKEMAEVMRGCGSEISELAQRNPHEAKRFMKEMSDKIKRIARLAGRMRGLVLEAKKQRVPVGVQPANIETVRDISHLLSSELAMLSPAAPELVRLPKVEQFTSSGLLGYEQEGDKPERGAFVSAVDTSPSMHGQREDVAKGLALGVAQVARIEGRPYSLFSFASDSNSIVGVKHTETWQKHFEWASNYQYGGTDFDVALQAAMNYLNQLPEEFRKKADLLFISDGEGYVSSQYKKKWEAYKEQWGCRLLFVPVGRSFGSIEEIADKVIPVWQLDEAAGAEVAKTMGSLI